MKKKTTSKASRTDYRRLRALKDEEIDLSDIPVVSTEQIADARARFELKDVPEGKTRVTMYLDNAVMRFFKKRAGARGYQTLINDTLAAFIEERSLEDMIRRVVREELRESKGKSV